MASIECNEISQVINELLIAFDGCNKIKNEDLIKLVELVAAVNECAGGGALYNDQISEVYEPVNDEVVTYPIGTYHSISVVVVDGNITQTIDSILVTYPKGTSLNTEVTTLNNTEFTFTVKAGSKVVVNYLVESV